MSTRKTEPRTRSKEQATESPSQDTLPAVSLGQDESLLMLQRTVGNFDVAKLVEQRSGTSSHSADAATPAPVGLSGEIAGESFLFERGREDFRPGEEKRLRDFASVMQRSEHLVIHGFASEEGSVAFNERLSSLRAHKAAKILAEEGIGPSQIDQLFAHGEMPGDRAGRRSVVIDKRWEQPRTQAEPAPTRQAPSLIEQLIEKIPKPSEIGVKFEIPFGEYGPKPAGPVLISFSPKITFDAVLKAPYKGVKVLISPLDLKTEFSKSFGGDFGKWTPKVSLEQTALGKVGVEWNAKGSPVERLVGDHLSVEINSPLLKLLQGRLGKGKAPVALSIKVPFQHGDLAAALALPVPEGCTLPGKVTFTAEFGLYPNPGWPGWYAVGAGAAGTALVVGSVAFVAYGIYKLGEAHEVGRTLAMREAFADGYANTLSELTAPWANLREIRADPLMRVDWKPTYDAALQSYVEERSFAAARAAKLAGQAAILQDIARILETDPEGWKRISEAHSAKYGTTIPDRARAYRAILRRQAASGENVGIPLI